MLEADHASPKATVISLKEIAVLAICAVIPGGVLAAIGLATGNPGQAVWAFAIATKAALITAVAVGLPLVLLMNLLHKNSLVCYSIVAVIVAIALAGYFIVPNITATSFSYGWPSFAAQFFILLLLSEIACLFYWWAARPDKLHRHNLA
jgi:hypothetical protein